MQNRHRWATCTGQKPTESPLDTIYIVIDKSLHNSELSTTCAVLSHSCVRLFATLWTVVH